MVGVTYSSYKSYNFSFGGMRRSGHSRYPKVAFSSFLVNRVSDGWTRPSVLQVVEFSDPSFVFAPARDCHNTIFCPFRFKSAVIALFLDGSSLVS